MVEKSWVVRGVRGATVAKNNEAGAIYAATRELLGELVEKNSVSTEHIAAAFFSSTPDLNSAFPARAAREMGWLDVPLFCHVEIDVPGSIKSCIRILLLINTWKNQEDITHIYLRGTETLRAL